jgi:hypothetical protein
MEAFHALTSVDKAYFTGYTEEGLEKPINDFVRNHYYDYYILVSDDAIVSQKALDLVIENASSEIVIGGWCRFNPSSDKVAMRIRKFFIHQYLYPTGSTLRHFLPKFANEFWYKIKQKTFVTVKDVDSQDEIFPVYWLGWNLACMSRRNWIRYPFQVYKSRFSWIPKEASDVTLFERLQKDRVPVYCIKQAEILHLGTHEGFFLGQVTPSVIMERSIVI